MLRDDVLLWWVRTLDRNRAWRWLDIGAGTGVVSQQIAEELPQHSYTCYDVAPRGEGVLGFDGRQIPERYTVDFVLFNFVLHHAASNIEALLQSALGLADTLVIQEDLPDGTKATAKALRDHDPHAVYYTEGQWRRLFERLSPGCQVKVFPHNAAAADIPGYHVPRALFIVGAGVMTRRQCE